MITHFSRFVYTLLGILTKSLQKILWYRYKRTKWKRYRLFQFPAEKESYGETIWKMFDILSIYQKIINKTGNKQKQISDYPGKLAAYQKLGICDIWLYNHKRRSKESIHTWIRCKYIELAKEYDILPCFAKNTLAKLVNMHGKLRFLRHLSIDRDPCFWYDIYTS